jgi:hypothetical protein
MSGLSKRERELKLASADLFDDAVGKYELAGEAIGLQKSQAHRCCSPNDDSSFFNLRHIAAMERRAARPLVTMALARQAGGVFIRLPEDFGDASGLPMQVVGIVKEVGDVADALREGLADDDRLDRTELARIEREFDDLIDKTVQGRAQVRAMQGKPAAPVRVAAVREAS